MTENSKTLNQESENKAADFNDFLREQLKVKDVQIEGYIKIMSTMAESIATKDREIEQLKQIINRMIELNGIPDKEDFLRNTQNEQK